MASTSWEARILGLGLFIRELVVDPDARHATISKRTAWFFRSTRTYAFDQIEAVTYGYEDLNWKSSFTLAHDAVDRYVVGLRLYGEDELRLFSFIGNGAYQNSWPMPDWVCWPAMAFDLSGTQESDSRMFVQVLSKLIGVGILPSTLVR